MKKAFFIIAFTVAAMIQSLSAQTFKSSFSFNNSDRKLSFFIRPIGANITSAIGYFEFTVRHAVGSSVTFGAITNNTATFSGLNMVPGTGVFGGANLQRYNFTSTIPSQTYVQNTDYLVFSVVLGGSGMPTLDLITNYVLGDPTFAVTDGGGNQLWDPANLAIFYPSQMTSGNTIFYSLTVVLPIELTFFNARSTEKTIDLKWQTERELAFSGFEIERSADGFSFEKIGFEKGKGSSGRADYSFSDATVLAEKDYFYRLKMQDLDGRFTVSNIEKGRIGGAASVKITPNPVRDFLNVEVEKGSSAAFSIFDAAGKSLFSGNLDEKGSSQINVSSLAEGFYVLRIFAAGGSAEDFRFLKQGN